MPEEVVDLESAVVDKWDAFARYEAEKVNFGELAKTLLIPGHTTYAIARVTNRRHKINNDNLGCRIADHIHQIPMTLAVDCAKALAYVKLIEYFFS